MGLVVTGADGILGAGVESTSYLKIQVYSVTYAQSEPLATIVGIGKSQQRTSHILSQADVY